MSTFADAIMNNMIASMDPALHMQRDAMQGFLAQQQNSLKLEKARTVKEINALLAQAITDDADPVVIQTYKELLQSLV